MVNSVWIFGSRDTAHNLSRELNKTFDRYRNLLARIQTLIDVNKKAFEAENTVHDEKLESLQDVYTKNIEREVSRHDDKALDLAEEMNVLGASHRLAAKIVNFADEE